MDEEWVRAALTDGMPAAWIAETVAWPTERVRRFARDNRIRFGYEWSAVSTKIRDDIRLRELHWLFAPTINGR